MSPSSARRPSSPSARSPGLDQLEELRRPWIDEVPIRVRGVRRDRPPDPGGRRRLARRGHRPLLDARLGEPRVRPRGIRDRRREGPHDRRPPGPRVLGGVVPGRLGLGDARADPTLVLLAALHVGRAHRSCAVPARSRLREDARRERPRDARLVGQHDRRRGRVRRAWARMSCAGSTARSRRTRTCSSASGRRTRCGASCSRSGTPASSSSTTRTSSRTGRPNGRISANGPDGELEPLDRWLVERTRSLVVEARAGYESWLTVDVVRAYESFVDDVSNWYIRRSRRRFWDGDPVALRTLWYALVQGLRVVAPLMPFLTDHLWRVLTAALRGGAGLRPPRGLAGDGPARLGPSRRDRRAAPRRRARTPGARDVGREAPAAAARARRRGRSARRGPRGGDRGRAAGARRLVRARRRERAPREAEPPPARAEARQGARCGARGTAER